MKEVEDLKQQISSHDEEYGKKIDKACKEYLHIASDDFQTFFKSQGFQVESSPSRERDNRRGMNITATYNDLSFSLELPHYEDKFLGYLSACLFKGKGIPESKIILVRKGASVGFSSRSYAVPSDEDERLKQEISHLRGDLEKAKERASMSIPELDWLMYDAKEQPGRGRDNSKKYPSIKHLLAACRT